MYCQVFFSILVAVMTLCVAPSAGAPASFHDALGYSEMLSKRVDSKVTMCGVPIRGKADCRDTRGNWKKDPVNNVIPTTVSLFVRGRDSQGSEYEPSSSPSQTDSEASDHGDVHECDHAVELQLLAYYGDESGFCTALESILKSVLPSVGVAEKKVYIDRLKALINTSINLYPIYSKWNAKKKDLTMSYKKGKTAPNPPDGETERYYNKVKQYVQAIRPYTVETNMVKVAANLDTAMTSAIEAAQQKVMKAAATGKTTVPQKATVHQKAAALQKAASDQKAPARQKAPALQKATGSANHMTWAPVKTMEQYVKDYITYIEKAAGNPVKP